MWFVKGFMENGKYVVSPPEDIGISSPVWHEKMTRATEDIVSIVYANSPKKARERYEQTVGNAPPRNPMHCTSYVR